MTFDPAQRASIEILVVDDEEMKCKFIRDLLNDEGYLNVEIAHSAKQAYSLIDRSIPDISIIDYVLDEFKGNTSRSEETGLSILRYIKNTDKYRERKAKILIISSKADLKIKALSEGAQDFVMKDSRPDEMLAVVNRLADDLTPASISFVELKLTAGELIFNSKRHGTWRPNSTELTILRIMMEYRTKGVSPTMKHIQRDCDKYGINIDDRKLSKGIVDLNRELPEGYRVEKHLNKNVYQLSSPDERFGGDI